MGFAPDTHKLGSTELSMQALEQSRVSLHALIERCRITIVEASKLLEQLESEGRTISKLDADERDRSN
jgi:hypothetical protein